MEHILKVNNLSKSFGGVHALADVSFQINTGEMLGLIGPNGSGKSTCINVISGVYSSDAGEVLYYGKNILKSGIAKRSKLGIGRTFQSPKPFTGISVFDSVFTIALQANSFKHAADKAEETLDMTGLLEFRNMPSEKLSIELRKWLDLARILVTNPKLIMLDEVMAGLNPSEMSASIDLVRKVNETGVTILFVEHVMKAVVSLCKRIVVLNEGRVLCEGMPEDVMRNPEVIAAYLGGGYASAAAQ